MKNLMRFAILFLCLSFIQEPITEIRGSVVLQGSAYNDKSAGIASFKVCAYKPGTTDSFCTITDSIGQFRIKLNETGVYHVVARKDLYNSVTMQGIVTSMLKTTYVRLETAPYIRLIPVNEPKNEKWKRK